jgi:hypothetical protein
MQKRAKAIPVTPAAQTLVEESSLDPERMVYLSISAAGVAVAGMGWDLGLTSWRAQ